MAVEDGHPLEPSADELRRLVAAATERIVAHLGTLGTQPATYDEADGPAAAELVREPWPPAAEPLDDLLDRVFDQLAPVAFNTAGPGFMAYIPGGGLPFTAVADLIAESLNRYTTVWTAAPGMVEIEATVVRWFARMVGLPEGAGGFLSSGGSTANLSALVAARGDRLRDDFDRRRRGTIYVSSQVHHSVTKAAAIAGFPEDAVRAVEVDDRFRLRLDRLEECLQADRAAGREPFLLVASAGTTNTGAVDPLPEMAEIARRDGLWFHVDAAYGGFFALTERGRRLLAGMERADSVVLDPHKGLFLPYGTGCLLVRDPATLRRVYGTEADYMPDFQDGRQRVDFAEISPELSRSARGLRVWLPLKLLGVEPFRQALDEKLDLARWLAEQLEDIPGVELVARPQLSNLAFRWAAPELTGNEQDDLNRRFLDAINSRRRVFLSGARLRGRFTLRISVLHFRTHREHAETAIDDIRAAVSEVTAEVNA